MYGKAFATMYEGSMYGAGCAVFAVWGYVIAHAVCGRCELNPKQVADVLGGTQEEINAAISYLCRPDPDSRNKECDGRRLVREGQYQYYVPSQKYYRKIQNEAQSREYNRVAQAEHRARVKARETALSAPLAESVARVATIQ